jgi:hypothetical protein
MTEGYTYIECDPRGYKRFKIQTIRSLIKKGYIEVNEPSWKLNDPYFVTNAVTVLIPVPMDTVKSVPIDTGIYGWANLRMG